MTNLNLTHMHTCHSILTLESQFTKQNQDILRKEGQRKKEAKKMLTDISRMLYTVSNNGRF